MLFIKKFFNNISFSKNINYIFLHANKVKLCCDENIRYGDKILEYFNNSFSNLLYKIILLNRGWWHKSHPIAFDSNLDTNHKKGNVFYY